jgi:hypothetical protein
MARRTTSIKDKRQEAEAAEARGLNKPKARKKAAARPRTTRKKAKAPERKRLSWVIYSGTQKEFARFPYDQRAEADAKLEEMKAKGRKNYYLQPVKELLSTLSGGAEAAESEEESEE